MTYDVINVAQDLSEKSKMVAMYFFVKFNSKLFLPDRVAFEKVAKRAKKGFIDTNSIYCKEFGVKYHVIVYEVIRDLDIDISRKKHTLHNSNYVNYCYLYQKGVFFLIFIIFWLKIKIL